MRTWLKEIRANEKLTMSEVAKRSDITESYYSLIESGKRGIRPTLAKKIADSLDFKKYGLTWTKFFEETA